VVDWENPTENDFVAGTRLTGRPGEGLPRSFPAAIALVTKCAQGVLDARAQFKGASLADLYDPNTMPPALAKAHTALDKAVDKTYGQDGWKGTDTSDLARAKFLFTQYDALATTKPAGKAKGRSKGAKK